MRYADVIGNTTLRDKYIALAGDSKLTDQEDDLALLRAMTEMIVLKAFRDDTPIGEMPTDRVVIITTLLEKVTNLVEAINNHKVKMGHMVSTKAMTRMVEAVTVILQKHISDHNTLLAIVADITAVDVSERPDRPQLEAQ